MINRTLIRNKVVQLVYASQESGQTNMDSAEKEFMFSLAKSYDLYMYMLALIVDVHRIAERNLDVQVQRSQRLHEHYEPNLRFVQNKFVLQLQGNLKLRDFVEHQKKTWMDEEEFVRRFFKRIEQSECYTAWMSSNAPTTYEEDRDFWKRLYTECFLNDEDLAQVLEEQSVYWNDDRFIVDSFVFKTIRQFQESLGVEQPLCPDFDGPDDEDFAKRLFRAAMLGADTYRTQISKVLHNWDPERVAKMDMIILQVALAELYTFPSVPLPVVLNEYIEIAKYYSTPNSTSFINGTLDVLGKKIKTLTPNP